MWSSSREVSNIPSQPGYLQRRDELPGENVICASKKEAFYPDTGAAALTADQGFDAQPVFEIHGFDIEKDQYLIESVLSETRT